MSRFTRRLSGLLLLLLTVTLVQAERLMVLTEHDGVNRRYILYVPDSYDPEQAYPLVIALHPAGGSAPYMADMTGFDTLAERDGVIVLYPEGPYGYWDYGAGLPSLEGVPAMLDDPGYIAKAVAEVQAAYNIDPDRLYAVGFSNGARMAYRLGCELPLAAIAGVAATISNEVTSACPEDRRFSAFFMHGTKDSVIPWHGKPLHIESIYISNALSAPDTAQFWASQNQCDDEPTISQIEDSNPDYRVQIEVDTFGNCEAATAVIFYRVLGGDHTWYPTRDFDTSAVVWSFLTEQKLLHLEE
jgi:polyhydroxybutyrate depolymerase